MESLLNKAEMERIICYLQTKLYYLKNNKKQIIKKDPKLELEMKTLIPYLEKSISFWILEIKIYEAINILMQSTTKKNEILH